LRGIVYETRYNPRKKNRFDKVTGEGMARLLNYANAEHYLAYLDGTPVGIGTLFVDGKVGVVSNCF